MQADWYLIAGCLTALCVVVPAGLIAHRHDLPPGLTFGVVAIALLGGAVRIATVAPAFVHAEFYGPGIVNTILEMSPDRLGRHHGLAASFTLGQLAFLLGRSAEGILRGNLLLATLATLPVAALARRLCARPSAAIYAAVLWSTSPLVARLGYSEDADVAGALFGSLALLGMEIGATDGSWIGLGVAAAAGPLMVLSRQPYYAWVPVIALLWIVRRTPRAGPRFRTAGFVVVGAIVALAGWQVLSRQSEELDIVYQAYRLLAARPASLWGCLVGHPGLDWRRLSPLVVGLALPGTWWLCRWGRARIALFSGLLVSFGTSLPAAWPSPGPSWGFRLPFYALLLIVVAAGAVWLEQLAARWSARRAWIPVAALLAVASSLAGGAADNRVPDAEFGDYLFLRDQLAALDRHEPIGLIVAPHGFPHPRYAAPDEVARLLQLPTASLSDARAGRIDGHRRWYFYDGMGCHAATVFERLYPDLATEREVAPRLLGESDRLALVLFDRSRRFGLDVVGTPTSERAECVDARAATEEAGLRGPRFRLRQDPPSAIFSSDELIPELRRWPRALP